MIMVASTMYQAMIWMEVDEGKAVMFCRDGHLFKPAEFTWNIFIESRIYGKRISLTSLSLVSAIYSITHCSRNTNTFINLCYMW